MKLRGINLVPRITDTGNGPNSPTFTPANFYDLLYDIGIEGPTGPAWLQWMKPQIDIVVDNAGPNCFRIIFVPELLVGDASHHSPATFRGTLTLGQFTAMFALIANYLASRGAYFYPAAAEPSYIDPMTPTMMTDYIAAFVPIASDPAYRNIIGLDLIQEFDRSVYVTTPGVLNSLMATARAGLARALPITNSLSYILSWEQWIPVAVAAGVDYLDIHIYFYGEPLILTLLGPNSHQLPLVVGETGIGFNGFYFNPAQPINTTVHPYSSELRARHYMDMVSALGHRFDLQLVQIWGTVDEWNTPDQRWGIYQIAQDASYNFTTPNPEMIAPYLTVPKVALQAREEHVLDLSGPDTTPGAWTNNTTFTLGWAQLDAGQSFSRNANRVKRTNGAIGVGLVDYYGLPSVDQSVSVDFDAAQAVPSGGQAVWSVSLRHQGDTFVNLNAARYYFASINYQPTQPLDGQLNIYRVDGGYTSLDAVIAAAPFNPTHRYRLTFSCTGIYPTVLVATLTDLTTATVMVTRTVSDAAVNLQAAGSPGLPTQIGEVYYTNVRYITTNNPGPTLQAPTIGTVTETTVALSWAAPTYGIGPYLYIPQYAALDANGFVIGSWTSLPPQTGLTATVTGLTTATRYTFRIRTQDGAGSVSQAA
ncbi:MAG: fibronectin type III domain-containing protein [Vicinamibacterales bacterium]